MGVSETSTLENTMQIDFYTANLHDLPLDDIIPTWSNDLESTDLFDRIYSVVNPRRDDLEALVDIATTAKNHIESDDKRLRLAAQTCCLNLLNITGYIINSYELSDSITESSSDDTTESLDFETTLEGRGITLEDADAKVEYHKARIIISAIHTRHMLSIARYVLDRNKGSMDMIPLESCVKQLDMVTELPYRNRTHTKKPIYVDPLFYGDSFNFGQNVKDHVRDDAKLSINITYDDEAKELAITVSDDGPGIDPGEVSEIFKQGYSTKPEHVRGPETGLGLYLAKQGAKEHEGHIEVETWHDSGHSTYCTYPKELDVDEESQENTGTVFKLIIPMVETETAIVPKMYEEIYREKEQRMDEESVTVQETD